MVAARQWWSVKELAEYYGLSPRTVYDAIATGQLVAHRFGRKKGGLRVAEEDRVRWENNCRGTPSTPAIASTAIPPTQLFGSRLPISDLVQNRKSVLK